MYIISGLLLQDTHTPTLQHHIHITSQSICHMFFLSRCTHSMTTLATSAIYIILQQLQQLQPTNPANATAARVLAVAGSFSTLALLLRACLRLCRLAKQVLSECMHNLICYSLVKTSGTPLTSWTTIRAVSAGSIDLFLILDVPKGMSTETH